MDDFEKSEYYQVYVRMARLGLTEEEVRGGAKCLIRELGRVPTYMEMSLWIKSYMEWRGMEQALQSGEIEVNTKFTKHGLKVAKIAAAVNKILQP